MEVFYTIKGEIYEPTDVTLALQCAEAAFKQYGWPVRTLIETLQQKDVFCGVQGFSEQGSNLFKFNSINGEITTRRQYQAGRDEIIVTVCPTIQLLQMLQQDTKHIKALIVVPEMKSCADIYHWLDLNSATDIQSRATLNGIGLPSSGVKRAIGYLMDYCQRMDVDMTHTPLYSGEIADVANTLKMNGITANYEEVVKYCLKRDLSYNEAEILAKAFSQKSPLAMRGKPNYDLYWQNINDSKWE